MTVTASDFSIIIPSYQSSQTILACLVSLHNQESQPLEIIVVDSSSDETPDLIRRHFPKVQLFQFKEHTFPGPARNLGVKRANGSIIAFIDSDCIAEPDWVQRLVQNHACGHEIVGGAVEVANPSSTYAWAGHISEFREFLPIGKPHSVLHIPTCNISYRKELFLKAGGFPNAYYPQEDLLFNFLLYQQGFKIWFDPGIRIKHRCREGLQQYLSHQHRFGRVTRCTLARIDLSGSFFARRPWLAWASSPFLGLVKFVRNSKIFFHRYPVVALQKPQIMLLLMLGAIWWARGFAAGAQTGLSGIRGWTDPHEHIFRLIKNGGRDPNEDKNS